MYKLCESQNYLYDLYYSISKRKTCKVNQKTHKYTSGKLEERKPQKIGDSSNNDRAGTWKCSIKNMFQKNFVKITGTYLRQILFLNIV